jgi:hypothetical protein
MRAMGVRSELDWELEMANASGAGPHPA